jgi:hypothetical protein
VFKKIGLRLDGIVGAFPIPYHIKVAVPHRPPPTSQLAQAPIGFTPAPFGGIIMRLWPPRRDQKITLGQMREMGVRGVLIYCSDYKCRHSTAISGDRWPDDVALLDALKAFAHDEFQ